MSGPPTTRSMTTLLIGAWCLAVAVACLIPAVLASWWWLAGTAVLALLGVAAIGTELDKPPADWARAAMHAETLTEGERRGL